MTHGSQLSFVASLFGGDVVREGRFSNLGMFRNAGADMLTIFYDERFRPQFEENLANFSCVLTTPALAGTVPSHLGVLAADKPLDIFLKLHFHLCEQQPEFYAPPAPVDIAPDARIHPSVVLPVRNVSIGPRTIIHPHAVIEENTVIGADCIIGPGVAIGGPGFEMRYIDGVVTYVPHAGGVSIGDGTHVLANACIARAVFGGATRIGRNCKIDHLVHVAHAAQVGDNCRLVAGSSIGGATQLGDDVWVGPNAVIANSLRIGAKAWVAMGAAVAKDVPAGQRVSGTFARPMP
jgi:acyl-[acyl carrier protein]--UDP-N-acetylglucosamine O-acyltransferase